MSLVLAKHLKLGKLPPRRNRVAKSLIQVVPTLPVVPNRKDWGKVSSPEMFLNDEIGDCAVVATANQIKVCSANRGAEVRITDAQVLAAYRAISGYNPNDPSTDVGCYLDEVMAYMVETGLAGQKLRGWCEGSPGNLLHLRAGIYLFGGAYAGLALPLTAQQQWDRGQPWDYVKTNTGDNEPGSWGGHGVPIPSFAFRPWLGIHSYPCFTWASVQPMTPAFVEHYLDEVHFCYWSCWDTDGVAPNAVRSAELQTDLVLL